MSQTIPVGVFLPSFVEGPTRSGAEIAAFARRAEDLGFASLWATDHLLHGSLFYGATWLEPLVTLTYAAAATTRVDLGTSILVMPTRNPVVLAKELATLQALSGERFILGAGTGWDEREFRAVGVRKAERGPRTDETIDIVRRLLAGERVTREDGLYPLDGVEVGPPMRGPLRVWVAGGRQLPHPSSPEPPRLAPRVLARIAASDGWIARPTAAPDQIAEDRAAIAAALGPRAASGFTFAHENFLHLVPTDDHDEALAAQRPVFDAVMGSGRPFDYLEQVYLTGSLPEVRDKLARRIVAGTRYLMLHTLVPSIQQLELWAEHLLPHLRAEGTDT